MRGIKSCSEQHSHAGTGEFILALDGEHSKFVVHRNDAPGVPTAVTFEIGPDYVTDAKRVEGVSQLDAHSMDLQGGKRRPVGGNM